VQNILGLNFGEIKTKYWSIQTQQKLKEISKTKRNRFPLVQGRVSQNVYNDVVDKVLRRLTTWKGNILNKAGRACLVKSVTTAIPVYTMQLHYLPTYVCNRLDKMAKSFH